MARTFICVAVAVCLTAPVATAQVLIGSFPQVSGFTAGSASPITFIDVSHPAVASGTINYVTLRWLGTKPCAGAFKVKVLHPTGTAGGYSITERGPFDSDPLKMTVQLTPGIAVSQGDLLAITQLQPLSACGSVTMTGTDPAISVLMVNSDVQGSVSGGSTLYGSALNASGAEGATDLAGVLPAAGALAGNFGSFFRTSVQLASADTRPLNGRFVFHPAGKTAADSDPSMAFTIPGPGAISFPDLITTMGQSGLGSLDIVTDGGVLPAVNARIFNDNGSAGTLGFNEDAITPSQALQAPEEAMLLMPADPANFRMNIGVRTFAASTISYTIYSSSGSFVAPNVVKSYPAGYFEQLSAPALLKLQSLPAGGFVLAYVQSGSAVVYASYTDNRTNDSSVKYAGR